MKNKYIDLIHQTFDFPQPEFKVGENGLSFYDIPLMDIIREYGTPLKLTYLPKISQNIDYVKSLFHKNMSALDYQGRYEYCYCTKSSHFSFVLKEALKSGVNLEVSSGFDINIIQELFKDKLIDLGRYIICNGFKTDDYLSRIATLINDGFQNVIPVFDNENEPIRLSQYLNKKTKVGIRIASEEDPKFTFYTSRLGIGYSDILAFYKKKIQNNSLYELKMLHFFINTGITDSAYYWNELTKSVKIYCELKKVCPSLDSLNIGGGFPIKNTLAFDYNYEYIVHEILFQIKSICKAESVEEPNVFTEFGSYTVGESGATIFSVLDQKKQNDRERWNMIDSSFMTTLPDTWALNSKFIMLAVNNWEDEFERVLLGGLTCDSDDFYNSEQHINAVFLPKFSSDRKQYIGFFNTGAYQESIGGFGGIQHCLIPHPKHVILDKDKSGNLISRLFVQEQSSESVLKLLGY